MVDFNPNDNSIHLSEIDWKARYEQLANERNWDEETEFVGLKRLGKTYSMLEPYYKFDGVPEHQRGYDRMWYPFITGGLCLAVSLFSNRTFSRNYYGNILSHVAWAAGGGLFGNFVYYWFNRRAKDREAVLRHYMILHEHELPIIERKKFSEIMRPWVPFRPSNGPKWAKLTPFPEPLRENL